MNIVITIQDASDGGVFVRMDPGAPQLLEAVVAGNGGSAHAYGLAAYRALHDLAMREAAQGGVVEFKRVTA